MGIPLKEFDCKNELRELLRDRYNSDEVPELSPVSLVKIYLYFAVNLYFEEEEKHKLAVQKLKVREKKLSSVCKAKNYWKSHVQAHALFFAFYKWA